MLAKKVTYVTSKRYANPTSSPSADAPAHSKVVGARIQ